MEEPIEQQCGKKAVALNIKISVDKGKDNCTDLKSKEKKGSTEQAPKCQKSGSKSKKACCAVGNFMPPPQPPRSQMLPCGCLVIYDDPCFSPNSLQPKSANKCNAGVQCCDTKRGLEKCAQGKKHGVCTSSGCQTSDQYHCIKKRGKQTCSTASSGCQTMATSIPKTKEQMQMKQHGHPSQPPQNRSVQAFFSTRDLQVSRPQMETRSVQYVPPSSTDVPTETIYKSQGAPQVVDPADRITEQNMDRVEKPPAQIKIEQSAEVEKHHEEILETQEAIQEGIPENVEEVENILETIQEVVEEDLEEVVETVRATQKIHDVPRIAPKTHTKQDTAKNVKQSSTKATELKVSNNSDKIVPTHKLDTAALQREKSKQMLPPLTKKIQNHQIEEVSDSGSHKDEHLEYDDEEDNEFEENSYGGEDEEGCDCEEDECDECSGNVEYENPSNNGNGWMDGSDLWGWDTWDKFVSLLNGEPIPNPCFQNCDCDDNNAAEHTGTEGMRQGGGGRDGDLTMCRETTSEDTYSLLIALPLVFLALMASLKGC